MSAPERVFLAGEGGGRPVCTCALLAVRNTGGGVHGGAEASRRGSALLKLAVLLGEQRHPPDVEDAGGAGEVYQDRVAGGVGAGGPGDLAHGAVGDLASGGDEGPASEFVGDAELLGGGGAGEAPPDPSSGRPAPGGHAPAPPVLRFDRVVLVRCCREPVPPVWTCRRARGAGVEPAGPDRTSGAVNLPGRPFPLPGERVRRVRVAVLPGRRRLGGRRRPRRSPRRRGRRVRPARGYRLHLWW